MWRSLETPCTDSLHRKLLRLYSALFKSLAKRPLMEILYTDLARPPLVEILYRDIVYIDLLQRSCQEAKRYLTSNFAKRACICSLYRDLFKRSCQEISYRDLGQRSCQDTSYSLIEICIEILPRGLLQRPCQQSTYRDLVVCNSASADLVELILHGSLCQRSCA